jgi:hypothetical protein
MVSSNAQAGIFRSSSHPMVLAALYFFRSAALAVYVLCGLFTDNYVLSVSRRDSFDTLDRFSWLNVDLSDVGQIVIVVVLLSLDFWNVKVRSPRFSFLLPPFKSVSHPRAGAEQVDDFGRT